MEKNHSCPICAHNCQICADNSTYLIKCPHCPEFKVSDDAYEDNLINKFTLAQKAILRGRIFYDLAPRIINRQYLVDISNESPIEVFVKAERLFQYIVKNNTKPGSSILITKKSYEHIAAGYAEDGSELKYLLDNILCNTYSFLSHTNSENNRYQITPEGWKHYLDNTPESRYVFCAMWFCEADNANYKKMKRLYESIEKVIKELGYICLRVDNIEHNDKICDKIIAEIKRSKFMIADFTGHRGGVYYEAGYAKGLKIPVIHTCSKDEGNKLHFDIRQYNHIFWTDKDYDKFEEDLKNRILATIDQINT